MHSFLIAQITGTIAVALSIAMYQFNNRRTMLVFDLFGCVFWALTFLELHALTGLFIITIAGVSNLAFIFIKPSKENRWLLILIVLAIVAATTFTWKGSASLLAMIGALLGIIRFWTANTTTIRRLSLIAPPFWFAYDLLTGNYPGVFIEVFGIVSNFVAQYRFDMKLIK